MTEKDSAAQRRVLKPDGSLVEGAKITMDEEFALA
jgi:hypothetical protein